MNRLTTDLVHDADASVRSIEPKCDESYADHLVRALSGLLRRTSRRLSVKIQETKGTLRHPFKKCPRELDWAVRSYPSRGATSSMAR
jgi:hypothetical protein